MKRILSLLISALLFPVPAWAGYTITNIGTAAGGSVTSLNVAGVTTPAGATIFAIVFDDGTPAATNFSDTAGNTYLPVIGATGAFGTQSVAAYCTNCKALLSGTVSYTDTSFGNTVMGGSWAYIIGAGALDTTVTTSGTGTNAQPSAVTSGVPTTAGDLFVAVSTGFDGGVSLAYTQDVSNPTWTAPPNSNGSVGGAVGGGTQVNAGTGTEKFQPTYTVRPNLWASLVFAFKQGITGGFPFIPSPLNTF